MGTELQFSQSFFTPLPKSHGVPLTMTFENPDVSSSSWSNLQIESSRRNQPIDTLQCIKESVGKTMLEHERTFRYQVRELHRVYKLQKLLMSQQEQDRSRNEQVVDMGQRIEEECDLELSLGIGKRKKKTRSGSLSDGELGSKPESSTTSSSFGAGFVSGSSLCTTHL
ncbi:uncharacterized protein LOC144712929 isoform X2 [Wolffia australiana]